MPMHRLTFSEANPDDFIDNGSAAPSFIQGRKQAIMAGYPLELRDCDRRRSRSISEN